MEFGIKKITETTVDDEEKGIMTKFAVKAISVGESEVEIVIKENGMCNYQLGDRLELVKIQSQTTLVPIKKGPGKPKKEE
jgi:hypothetical protein